jgi:hypothetical protein
MGSDFVIEGNKLDMRSGERSGWTFNVGHKHSLLVCPD